MKRLSITPGDVFGRWTVIGEAPPRQSSGKPSRYVLVRCACSTESEVRLGELRCGQTTSCGCLIKKHGMHGTRTYECWKRMVIRPKHDPSYRDRGITVCDRWRFSFPNFLADMGECPPGMSIDRVDNDGNYEAGNYRWATPQQQARNTRRNVWIIYNGERMCLTTACAVVGIRHSSISRKVARVGMTHQAAFDYFAMTRTTI